MKTQITKLKVQMKKTKANVQKLLTFGFYLQALIFGFCNLTL